jgi:redox-sensitive bicupin YhaK (pirin superfamily)
MIIFHSRQQRCETKPAYPVSHGTTTLAGYYDPGMLGGSHLQVLTEVWVAPESGFPDHSHHNTEIISYMLAGHLTHQDGLSHHAVIGPGDVQCISSGAGITHSEYNFSEDESAHFLQIWIEPQGRNLPPHYAKQNFSTTMRQNQLCLIASPDGRGVSLPVNQDVFIYTTLLRKDISVHYTQPTTRVTFIQVAKGNMIIQGTSFEGGDAAVLQDEKEVTLDADPFAEVLLFDLPYH